VFLRLDPGMSFKRLLAQLEEEHVEQVSWLQRELHALRSEVEELRGCTAPGQTCAAPSSESAVAVADLGRAAASQPRDEPLVDVAPRIFSSVGEEVGGVPHGDATTSTSKTGQRLDIDTPPSAERQVKSQPSAQWSDITSNGMVRMRSRDIDVLESRVVTLMSGSKSKARAHIADEFLALKGWLPKTKLASRLPVGKNCNMCRNIVDSRLFGAASSIAIVSNAVLLGIVTDNCARNGPDTTQEFVSLANRLFTAFFTVELLLRMFALGPCTFLMLAGTRAWNRFDMLVVCVDLLGAILSFTPYGTEDSAVQSLSVLRMLRILRLARALRILRLFTVFKELRLMVLSVLKSGKTLFWSLLLVVITIYIFSVFLLENVTFYLRSIDTAKLGEKDRTNFKTLQLRFGSMLQTCYTLFAALTGGVDWADLADGLQEVGWSSVATMVFFVFFMIFAMTNIITAVFVESATESVYNDRDEVIQEEMRAESSTLNELRAIFERIDRQQSGSMSLVDFEAALKNPATLALFRRLGIEITAAHGLFRLLDLDGSGSVTAIEFLVGCMKMRGGARSVDLATLMYENKRMMTKWNQFIKYIREEFQELRKFERIVLHSLAARAEIVSRSETCCGSSAALKAQL